MTEREHINDLVEAIVRKDPGILKDPKVYEALKALGYEITHKIELTDLKEKWDRWAFRLPITDDMI